MRARSESIPFAAWLPALTPQQQLCLARLRKAHDAARDVGRPLWQFGVELRSFAPSEFNDLRWLIAKGYVAHQIETSTMTNNHRRFRRGGLNLTHRSCFTLTEAGVSLAREMKSAPAAWNGRIDPAEGSLVPLPSFSQCMDGYRELRLGDHLVKRFDKYAPHQEVILFSFQKHHWQPTIDDPLPPVSDVDPRIRLRDAICRLNRGHANPLVRFHVTASARGQCIRWERLL